MQVSHMGTATGRRLKEKQVSADATGRGQFILNPNLAGAIICVAETLDPVCQIARTTHHSGSLGCFYWASSRVCQGGCHHSNKCAEYG
jgi:hypothetical protein